MEYGRIEGVTKPVSRMVLGTMIVTDEVEARPKGAWGDIGRKESFRLLDAVMDKGGNAFDTAHVYGIGGASERGLGLWMKERSNREEVVIISKGSTRPCPPAPYQVMPAFIDADIYESLARLQTDYIDVYLLHRDGGHPVGPIVETLNGHLEAGRLRAYGGSNWTHTRLAEANQCAAQKGMMPFVASQPHFSLAEQVESPHGPGCVSIAGPSGEDARAWYTANQMPVIPYSSLSGGLLSGRMTRENYESILTQGGVTTHCKPYCHEINFRRLDRVQQLAREMNVLVPQIALAFILQSGLDVFALTGARSGEEFAENAKALDVRLTTSESAWLDLRVDERR